MFFNKKMTTLLSTAVMLMILSMIMSVTVFAEGTQPPNKQPSTDQRTWICHFDSNDGQIHRNLVETSDAPVDRGVATEGHDTLATTNDETGCDQPSPTPVPAATWTTQQTLTVPTPTPVATPAPVTADVQPTATPTAVPTVVPTLEPTPMPTEEATPVPDKPSPDGPGMPDYPLPSCYPGGPEPCAGK